ncbi:MAG: FkbM family methyltransferase [Acidimicrobiales bacterium]
MPARTQISTKGSPVAVGGDGSPILGVPTPRNIASFTRRMIETVANWPTVLLRLGLASVGIKRGDIKTRFRDGVSIVAPPSRPAWWPTFEMFVEDVYHLCDLDDFKLGPDDVILDLGAHIGTSAVLFARRWPEATIVCVEPNPETFSYLERNIAKNNVRATLLNEAIGGVDGHTTLFGVDEASCEASTTVHLGGASREVPVASFERLMREAPGQVRIVKLDCEGAEHEVFAASTPELWSDVEVMLLEYHRTDDPASEWPATEARVNDLGFETKWQMPFDWYPGLGMAGFRRKRPS